MMKHILSSATALVLSTVLAAPLAAQTAAGSYLAGRSAAVASDFKDAAFYYTRALARDAGNVELIESVALAHLSLGQLDRALPLVRQLEALGQTSQVADIIVTANLAQAEDYAALIEREPDTAGIGPWVDGLVKGWAQVGLGDRDAALAQFDTLAREPGVRSFVLYHKALALAALGDFAGAEQIFAGEGTEAATRLRRGVIAYAEVLAQLGRFEDAAQILNDNLPAGPEPERAALLAKYATGEAGAFAPVTRARDGIAEVFFTFASVLSSEQASDYYVLLYARSARFLRPDHADALLLTAGLLESLGQHDLAIEEYKSLPDGDPAFSATELARAGTLRRSERGAQAIEVLENLARTHGDQALVHSSLGDALSGEDQFEAAIGAYTRALELSEPDNDGRWVLHYARGIAHERSDDITSAERDFRAALEIRPEQPQVLNYLGYSLVEEQRNLDEALAMIELAVEKSPDSGYIVDSLGWVFYRLGRYEEAEVQMEKAVQLLPVDPVVNDHLGDVLWAVGRQREAEFQWRRALSFIDPDDIDGEADPDRIRRKIDVGLDQVLQEEGAPPLRVSSDG